MYSAVVGRTQPVGRSLPRATQERRHAILRAALELFSERGFHGTAVPAIAQRAGVGAGTVYRNFESKRQLVNEVYRAWKRRIAEHGMKEWPTQGTPREQVAHIWRSHVAFARAHPDALSFIELHHHSGYLDEESLALRDGLRDRFAAMVAVMQARRALRDDIDPQVIIALFEGVFLRLREDGRLSLDSPEFDEAERCVWDAIRA